MALQQRSWLLHWALFVFFNKEGGLDLLLEFVLREAYVPSTICFVPNVCSCCVAVFSRRLARRVRLCS